MSQIHQTPAAGSSQRSRIIAAFAIVYIVWGSTYLAIHYAVATIPPFLMAATRFLIGGGALYLWARREPGTKPTKRQVLNAASVGVLLLTFGNGFVSWAELRVPSGLAALIVGAMPIWMVLFDAIRRGGRRPTPVVALGVLVGLVGQIVLVGPQAGGAKVDLLGVAALLFATMAWAAGSLRARAVELPASRNMTTALEMLAGGAVLLVLALLHGEAASLSTLQVSWQSALAVAYLIVFGSLLAFSAFVWLNTAVSPARVATYAYVNPVVAVFLGWAFVGEPVTLRTIVAAAIILSAVMMINLARETRPAPKPAAVPNTARLQPDG